MPIRGHFLVELFVALWRGSEPVDRNSLRVTGGFLERLLAAGPSLAPQLAIAEDAYDEDSYDEPLLVDNRSRLLRWAVAICLVGWAAVLCPAGVIPMEAVTLPCGLLLLTDGLARLQRNPELSSWQPLSSGLLVIFVPSWLATMIENPSWARQLFVTAGSLTLIVAGRRWAAAVVLGVLVSVSSVPVAAERLLHAQPRPLPIVILVVLGVIALVLSSCQFDIGYRSSRDWSTWLSNRDLRWDVAVCACFGVLYLLGVVSVEPATVFGGLALLAGGLVSYWRRPNLSSWKAFGSGLLLCLGPGWLASLIAEPTWFRQVFVILASMASAALGHLLRLKAPVLLGWFFLATSIPIAAWRLLELPWLVMLMIIAMGLGILALMVGANLEQRRRMAARYRQWRWQTRRPYRF